MTVRTRRHTAAENSNNPIAYVKPLVETFDEGTLSLPVSEIENEAYSDEDEWFMEDDAQEMEHQPNVDEATVSAHLNESGDRFFTGVNCFTVQDIYHRRVAAVAAVKDIGIPLDEGAIEALLSVCTWQSEMVTERFYEDAERWLTKAGVKFLERASVINKPEKGVIQLETFNCMICANEWPSWQCSGNEIDQTVDDCVDTVFLDACGHCFCRVCVVTYLRMKARGFNTKLLPCLLGSSCGQMIPSSAALKLLPEVERKYLLSSLAKDYVQSCGLQSAMRACPSADCQLFLSSRERLTTDDRETRILSARCAAGHSSCLGCTADVHHEPVPCSIYATWLKHLDEDNGSILWMQKNSKDCPKCHSPIEKNAGCNHMTCKCGHHFCWICMSDWKNHADAYNCNRYRADMTQSDRRQLLERIFHYTSRYNNHKQSMRLERAAYLSEASIDEELPALQSLAKKFNVSYTLIHMYVPKAAQILLECRHTLMMTYAFAFYLDRSSPVMQHQLQLFEDNQRDLEAAVERLSALLQRGPDSIVEQSKNDAKKMSLVQWDELGNVSHAFFQQTVTDTWAYVDKRRTVLLQDTLSMLAAKQWHFSDSKLQIN